MNFDIKPIKSEGGGMSFDERYKKALVDLEKDVPIPELLLSKGQHIYGGKNYDTPLMTAGEFSVIAGPSKTKKSYLKSVFGAGYIGGQTPNYFPDLKTHRKTDYGIIDVDTEQGEFYSQHTFRRVPKLVGSSYDNYYPYRLRWMSAPDRLQFIEELLESGRAKTPKLMFIDGIADLMEDTNDLVMSNEVGDRLLRWTDDLKIHICVVIHNAYGTSKPTGHLGSVTTKKAESVLLLEPMDDFKEVIMVQQRYSRGASIDPFYFTLKQGIPYECNELGEVGQQEKTFYGRSHADNKPDSLHDVPF